jgi:GLPGLI family protein
MLKYKILAPLLLVVLDIIPVLSQNYIKLDTTIIRCYYKETVVPDTLNPGGIEENVMLLQIGPHISEYIDLKEFIFDSIIRVDKERIIAEYNATKQFRIASRGKIKLNIYKGYPDKKITVRDNFAFSSYLYEEDLVSPEWQLGKETTIVLGYSCKNARTFFRGREYEVWYTTEIPISEGPWKFTGLPGLILKISDTRNQLSWECVAIEKPTWTDEIYFSESNEALKVTRAQYLKNKQRYMDSPGGFISGSPMATSPLPSKAYEKRPYNPIELDIK